MKTLTAVTASLMLSFAASPALAEWKAEKTAQFVGGHYTVTNTKTGQTLSTRYKSEKQAKRAAKTLNKYDESVMAGPDGQGDFRPGGELPFN